MTSSTGKALTLLAAAILLAGCASSKAGKRLSDAELAALLADKPPQLAEEYKRLYLEGERNEVLNDCRIGASAIRQGLYEEAKGPLDAAIAGIEVIYADSPQAKKARKLWHEEGSKVFKGDPYERAMAYFYRGLLYYMDGEFDNARACFRSAQLQDAFAEEAQNRSDFAIMDYMEARCNMRLGRPDLAGASMKLALEAAEGQGGLSFPPLKAQDNLLVVAEVGGAPVKWGDGRYKEQLKYKRGAGKDTAASVQVDGKALPRPLEAADVYYQASTRGGRELDYILAGKANFKSATKDIGAASTAVGTELMAAGFARDDDDLKKGGAVLSALGIASLAVSSQVKPAADARYWETLPDTIWLLSARVSPGKHDLLVAYCDKEGRPLPQHMREYRVEVPGNNGVEALVIVKR